MNQLVEDLKKDFPDTNGFSRTNLFSIRKFYQFYTENSVQQLVGLNENNEENTSPQQLAAPNSIQQSVGLINLLCQVPWGHHILILTKIKEINQAIFYLQQTIKFNWSRAILILQIEQNLFQRQGNAITNFKNTLPEQQVALVTQLLKDPYNFGFLKLEQNIQELQVEKQLTSHITKFLLELGKGFAFIGRQYPLQVGEKDYRLDLLFYHIKLRCFVVIDLKTGEFEPEFAGKINFYLSVVDD